MYLCVSPFDNKEDNPLVQMTNRKVDNESPCLKPPLGQKQVKVVH